MRKECGYGGAARKLTASQARRPNRLQELKDEKVAKAERKLAEDKAARSERKRKSREALKNAKKKQARLLPGAWKKRHEETEKRNRRRERQRQRELEHALNSLGEA